MTTHFAFKPMDGKAFGPWYMVNQEKIIGLIYYYVKNTGDMAFLNEVVDGKTVLEHVIANATCCDDPSKPVALIDYGPSNSHLELRREYRYNHVMPDLNGRRYANYLRAAQSGRVGGQAGAATGRAGRRAQDAAQREAVEPEDPLVRFHQRPGAARDPLHRADVQALRQRRAGRRRGSGSAEPPERAGVSVGVRAAQPGEGRPGLRPGRRRQRRPGACTCFPPQIAERLYKAGRPDAAEDILRRILWWGERLPYWGDSIVAERIDYRKDTPLQCTIDGVAVAQCILFGMFGIDAQLDGSILVSPRPPAFAPQMKLEAVRLRGKVFDVAVDGEKFRVACGGKEIAARVGQTVALKDNGVLELAPDRKGAGEY